MKMLMKNISLMISIINRYRNFPSVIVDVNALKLSTNENSNGIERIRK
jgi:hypothetical protein